MGFSNQRFGVHPIASPGVKRQAEPEKPVFAKQKDKIKRISAC